MATLTYRYGTPLMLDHTPAAAIANGEVVALGAGLACGVSHMEMAAGELKKGALAVGGAVYEGVAAGNYDAWVVIYWDVAAGKFTTTSSGNLKFGYTTQPTTADEPTECLHDPRV